MEPHPPNVLLELRARGEREEAHVVHDQEALALLETLVDKVGAELERLLERGAIDGRLRGEQP